MKLKQLLKTISGSDRIRIILGPCSDEPQFDPRDRVLYCGYLGLSAYSDKLRKIFDFDDDPEVSRITTQTEIRSAKYEERGALPPYEPEITRMYEFKDLTVYTYFDIYIT